MKIPFDIIEDYVVDTKQFEFEGTKYYYVDRINDTTVKDIRTYTAIYQDSYGKFQGIDVVYVGHGSDCSLEEVFHDCDMYELERKEYVTYEYFPKELRL